jgi:tetratricopeptide (TPR) repeat protein
MIRTYIRILFFFAAILTVGACVTTKKKGQETSKFKKGYHNLTSRYNYWFNANELFNLTVDKLESSHKDNYSQILEIYPYAAVDPTASRPDLDNVILKSAKAIGLHRVSDWTDDCYLLVGQSQHLKRDFETSEATFRYIKEEFDPKRKQKMKVDKKKKKELTKKKKKKKKSSKKRKKISSKKKKKIAAKKKEAEKKAKEKAAKKAAKNPKDPKAAAVPVGAVSPYENGMKRTAAYPEAMIWFGRTLTERQNYDEAEFLYRELREDAWFPADLQKDLAMAEAYLWMKQKRYDRAVDPLTEAMDLSKKKREKARLAYILAQLYERDGRFDASYEALEVVLKSAPPYEMEFNARLHQIEAGWTNGKIKSAEANQRLERMAKDEKNLEYRDQIYYTMAGIALKDGLKQEAIGYLRQSLDFSQGNNTQRAESYLKLADLYFEEEDFVQAKSYYDSTLTVLPALDERFKRVENYSKNLTEIARLIQTITQNDSIVRIFYMDDAARKDLAKTIKKKREEEAAKAAEQSAQKQAEAPAKNLPPVVGAGVKPSTFYFYNEAFTKKGKKDFSKIWGERQLEDNWRRSVRISAGAAGEEQAGVRPDSAAVDGISETDLSDIFQNIPKSEAELEVLHASTYEAMYNLGTLFRDKLQNNRRCSGTLEDMQTRYPDKDKYEKETWYYCYLAFTDLGNQPRAKFYLDKLAQKHPNSPYTRAITDPNFLNATKERERELNLYYEQTFVLFQQGGYKEAYARCLDAPKKYGATNTLMPKFALLSALCTGNLEGGDAYCKALAELIARYPESGEATRAKEIARLLACKGFEVQDIKKKDETESLDNAFSLEDDKLHYFMVVINGDVKMDDIKSSISDYNREFHRLEQLRISNIFLGTDTNTPIIVIRKFDNKDQAMRYFNEVKEKPDFLGEAKGKKTYNKEFFAVTQENYRRVLKNRTLDGYREFFQENYLK